MLVNSISQEIKHRVKLETDNYLKMKEYVLGFAFNEAKNNIVLIEKTKPEWQAGSLNGVGGKVEEYDEDFHSAMSREFLEETGVFINPSEWDYFASMTFEGGSAVVYCFRVFSDKVLQAQTIEEEQIKVLHIDEVCTYKTLKNLNVLIPAALDEDFVFCNFNIK